MLEILREVNDNNNYLEKNLGEGDIHVNEEEKNEEQQLLTSTSSSTSMSSTNNQYNELSEMKSKTILKNIINNKNVRKLSTPLSFSENFVLNFIKLGKETRSSYFNKLISKGLLNPPDISKKHKLNNIFIFDWDDTLLCTSVISPLGYFDDSMIILPSKIEKMKQLEILVKKILSTTINLGDTYIITNSEPGWVEYSCKRFFPDIFELLSKIKIISARGLFENKYPKNFKAWKIISFNEIIKKYNKNLPTNIICFGDSSYEIEAAHGLEGKFPNGFIKAIKFMETPKIEELINQLKIILDKFNYIYSACKNWTITVIKKKKKNNDEN